MAIKQIGKDETAKRDFVVNGKMVAVTHTVRPNRETDNRYNLTWNVDFAGVTDAEVLELAARTIVIRLQHEWRQAKNKMDEKVWQNATFKVRAVLDESRKTADPLTKAEGLIGKLSAAEKAQLLKLLQAK